MRIKLGFVETDKIYIERLIAALIRFYFAGTEIYSYMDIGNANRKIEEQRDDIVPLQQHLQSIVLLTIKVHSISI